MPISDNSRAVLEEMRKNGVDPAVLAGLERELDSKPNADKSLSDGVLAQPAFNAYRTKKDKEVEELKNNLAQLSSLKNAVAGGLDTATNAAALERIAALENLMVTNGFDLNDVREEVDRITSDPAAFKKLMEDTNTPPIKKEESEMPNQNNGSYVDSKTFADTLQTGLTNIAVGGMGMSIHIARAMREADKLGIDLTDDKLDNFQNALVKGLEQNKTPQQIADEHFGFQAVRQQKLEEQKNAELQAAREEGRREALKEAGISLTRRDTNKNPHPILDRKRIGEKIDSRVEKVEDLPKNQMGIPEYYRLRRFNRETRRTEHAANAAARYDEVSQLYDADGMNISNLQRQ